MRNFTTTCLSLTPEHREKLAVLSELCGRSRSNVVRQIFDAMLDAFIDAAKDKEIQMKWNQERKDEGVSVRL
jgi:predicted DNA-binding protein